MTKDELEQLATADLHKLAKEQYGITRNLKGRKDAIEAIEKREAWDRFDANRRNAVIKAG